VTLDLRTRYLGLDLAHPVVASAGPHTGHLDSLGALADAGVAAVVLPSLFEEDVVRAAMTRERVFTQGTEVFAEALTYLPEPEGPDDLDRHLVLVADAAAALDIPVIASLNGTTTGGWLRYASELVDAGAAALELNVYGIAADPADTATMVEGRTLDLVRAVRAAVGVPLAVKISPFFSALAHLGHELVGAGADGLVLFNRFYQPDLDLETLDVTPSLTLSTSADLRLPLRWIALLRGELSCSLAASSGVHEPADALKAILAGADVVMTTSAVLHDGPGVVTRLRDGIAEWLTTREYDSVAQARGSVAAHTAADPSAYERANYVRVLRGFSGS
jgi:dihydroorotate dehydrogenase (fumarate)